MEQDSLVLDDKVRCELYEFLHHQFGIDASLTGAPIFQEKLNSFLRIYGLPNVAEGLKLLKSDSGVCEEIGGLLFSQSTHFNRDPHHFEFMKQCVSNFLEEGLDGCGCIKVWSMCCSTGQEAYSIAFHLDEFLENNSEIDYSIVGSDCSSSSIVAAKRARYSRKDVAPYMPKWLSKYFEELNHEDLLVVDRIYKKIKFEVFNFISSDYIGKKDFDFVFLRNSLDYHSVAGRELVLRKLQNSIRLGGILIIGEYHYLTPEYMLSFGYKELVPGCYRFDPS